MTCIVVGNGPSLNMVPPAFLTKYPTFGTNRCYLKFTPTYYVCMNSLVLKQNRDDINALECDRFVKAGYDVTGHQIPKSVHSAFSFEPLEWVNEGYTVTYVCLQLAFWMGFRTVLLVGCDHRYIQEGNPNMKQVLEGDDPNHFDPAYFRGQKWQLADLAHMEQYYAVARRVFERAKRRIINLGPDSALDVFEKGNLNDWT